MSARIHTMALVGLLALGLSWSGEASAAADAAPLQKSPSASNPASAMIWIRALMNPGPPRADPPAP